MYGILAIDGAFEVVCGAEAIGPRVHLDAEAVAALKGFTDRYNGLLASASYPAAGLLALGRDLYHWLDGDNRRLGALLQQAQRPLRFEICAANRYPSPEEWALLRAPWELLADQQGFLAGDVGLGFSPVRRIGRRVAAPAPGKHRLGLVFMAASPFGVDELDYEAEETAIMAAVGSTKLDLLVEESGNPDELGERLTEYEAMQALHLSCHGHNAWPVDPKAEPRPVLLLETEEGSRLPTTAAGLIGALRGQRPQFVFLSACLTAAAGGERRHGLIGGKDAAPPVRHAVAHSLAEALIDAGLPAVLGWDGSVADGAATAFAATLYDELEGRAELADAVASARRSLLNAPGEARRSDWHMARLWLGPQGGGPLVGGNVRRPMMPATQGQKEFLIKERQQVPVASHEMFVGRRRELQKALRALRDGAHAGVLLHGMGRLGKSSLAARIANRRRDLRLAVVFGHYGALDILAALSEALKDSPKAREAVKKATDEVRQDASRLEAVLTDLLCGPCGQTGETGSPVLLVIDDLEQILEAGLKGGRHRLKSAQAPVLRAVLRAFETAIPHGASRVLLTSRFPFTLDGLERLLHELPLPPLSDAAQKKLELRQKEAAADAGLTGRVFDERKGMLARVPGLARGNPGLQDLIGRKVILSAAVPVARAGQILDEMEAWLAQGDLPSEAEVRAFLENLALDGLLDLGGAAGQAALRKLTLFDLPAPSSVADTLMASEGGSLAHLRDLGLIDVFEDMVDRRQAAFAVNALVAGRLEPLTENDKQKLAQEIMRDLFVAWGGVDGAAERPSACDLQLTRLGLLAEDGGVVAACATDAMLALRQAPAAMAAAFGREAIALLDAQSRASPWRLLSETASALSTLGDGAAADKLLERGVAALEDQRGSGAAIDPVAAGFLVYEQARRLMTLGDLDQAQALFIEAAEFADAAGKEISATIARGKIADILSARGDLDEALRIRREELLPAFERLGDVRSRAVAMGKIADILYARGDLDEALRIRREEQLPVYERLGDVRSRAVTMGQIADILYARGDLDEALRIRREEELPVFERLGDVRSRAVAMGRIADILSDRGDLDEALRIRREEQLPVYERLGDVRERAVAMGRIADILSARGDLDEALRIRREELLPAFERLGDVRSRAVTMGQIADILSDRGDLDEALRIRREEELPVYERLGDVRERAVTMGQIADILSARGDLDEALRILRQELLPAFERLGDVRSRAVTMGKIADILSARGDLDEALRIRREEQLPVYERLGDVRERAVAMGRIADILYARGDLDEALRIRREEQLPVYERLGGVRERAVTMGKISHILVQKGDIGAARALQMERLETNQRLADLDGIAATLWDLAQLDLAEDKVGDAIPRIFEAYGIVTRLGRAEGIAAVGMFVGQILAANDQPDEARQVLQRSAEMFGKLGQQDAAEQARDLIQKMNLG